MQVHVVLEAAPPRLEDDREVGVLADGGQQLLGALARQPERRAAAEPRARQQQGGAGGGAEAGAEEAGVLEPRAQQLLERLRAHQAQQLLAVHLAGRREDEAVVVVDDLELAAVALGPRRLQRQGERAVDLAAPQGVHHHLPGRPRVLGVGDVLDDHPVAVGELAGGGLLAEQHPLQRPRRAGGEEQLARQAVGEVGVAQARLHLLEERRDLLGALERVVALVGAPERRQAGRPRGRAHQHVGVGDLGDAVGAHAEAERVADRALPHELLVELAEQRPGVGEAQAEVAPVRDRAAGRVDAPRRPGTAAHRAGHAVDAHHRVELADARRGEAAGQHVEHQVEVLARQVRGTGGRAAGWRTARPPARSRTPPPRPAPGRARRGRPPPA